MKNIGIAIFIFIIYLIINQLPFGDFITLPITLFVTFLHEFGHAIASLISGGTVHGIDINIDGSGCTTSSGGINSIVCIGGYIGSIILGNLMILLSNSRQSRIVIYVLSALMIFTSLYWFSDIYTTLMLITFSIVLILLSKFKKYVLLFLGIASVAYIIKDYDVGPSSDLAQYSGIISAQIWMYVWLILAVVITTFSLYIFVKLNKKWL